MQNIFELVVKDNHIHSRWLNTLSMMENTGARKIKKCEHPVLTTEMILKHAAEEARHAWYLKKQIRKINGNCPTYERVYLLAPTTSYYYLHELDIAICRFLQQRFGYRGDDLKYAAYLLVTYAIEVRADDLYPQYQQVLDDIKSTVNVKSIIAEEIHHLAEMTRQLQQFSADWEELCRVACGIENTLFASWIDAVKKEVVM